MSIETAAVVTAKWLWDSYGKDITDKTINKFKEKWVEFKWQDAEEKYRSRLRMFCSTVRVLGNPKPINLDAIFTDVYVLDKPTAFQRFDIQELQARAIDFDTFQTSSEKRKPALRLAIKEKRLFILGKPGAGKTTFLKYLTLKSIDGQLPKTPIFISLREWADSSLELLDFIIAQFEICSFPEPKAFVLQLLSNGNALVLFDGLDEVNIEGNQRSQMINTLTNFAKRFQNIHICLTCRIAATDYSFDQFTYLEIADFDKGQQDKFISKWYQDDKKNLERFQCEFVKSENRGLRDLARTPLLLTLLCLAFDETLSFPNRRVDLYKESLDALLKKWDSSRGIKRDEIYRKLSPARKEQMLARIAAENFESGSYFIAQEKIEKQITRYLQQLPDMESNCPDGDVILKSMESQHGILVERAHSIYSFSHLTFQEYFTARYIVENAADGTINRLIQNHSDNDRWHEVFLLTASLLDNGDNFFKIFLNEIHKILHNQDKSIQFLNWSLEKVNTIVSSKNAIKYMPTGVLLGLIFSFEDDIFLRTFKFPDQVSELDDKGFEIESRNHNNFRLVFPTIRKFTEIEIGYEMASLFTQSVQQLVESEILDDDDTSGHDKKDISKDRLSIKEFAEIIGIKLSAHELENKMVVSEADLTVIYKYIKACGLFLSCLGLAAVSDRKSIENQLLSAINVS
jgi:hypothetical protein